MATTLWRVECWNCDDGEGEGCTCMDDTCCCLEPTPPSCDICKGKGFYDVSQLSDDNYDRAIPLN
jgi:hypothetical protein